MLNYLAENTLNQNNVVLLSCKGGSIKALKGGVVFEFVASASRVVGVCDPGVFLILKHRYFFWDNLISEANKVVKSTTHFTYATTQSPSVPNTVGTPNSSKTETFTKQRTGIVFGSTNHQRVSSPNFRRERDRKKCLLELRWIARVLGVGFRDLGLEDSDSWRV